MLGVNRDSLHPCPCTSVPCDQNVQKHPQPIRKRSKIVQKSAKPSKTTPIVKTPDFFLTTSTPWRRRHGGGGRGAAAAALSRGHGHRSHGHRRDRGGGRRGRHRGRGRHPATLPC